MLIAIWGDELGAWVAAAELARTGNDVLLQQSAPGESSHRAEPGLMESLAAGMASGHIRLCSHQEALQAPWHWLASHPSDISHAESVCHDLSQQGPGNLVLINQSNFGIGASDRLHALLDHTRQQSLVCLPDTLQQGQALQQFAAPETLLVGCEDDGARLRLQALLRPFSSRLQQIQWMSRREAEFSKFAISGMLALRLGYINELANLADRLDVDIEVVRQGMSSDKRIGQHYLSPGCGFGGHHFTQYIEGLADILAETRHSTLLNTVLNENERQKELPFRKLWQHYRCDLRGRRIAIWGCAFKPGVASVDNAPSLRVIRALLAQEALIQVHDPEALEALQNELGQVAGLTLHQDPYTATQQADALLLLTEWPQYSSPDYERLLQMMHIPLVVDGRNLFEPDYLRQLGFTYYGVGR
ncbi:UDP binding domain-containing protein [Marinobacterium sp. MBR-109]|jgi:UDPglucose 6-dehydrogenase|uniref:UDP binding domain-containing protein n=1 Tax=Marinobacterium sp. MBR-109 TaxID=3156462 RepID=UPI0033947595